VTATPGTIQPGADFTAAERNELPEALNGTPGAGRLIRMTEVSDDVAFPVEVVNRSTLAAAPIARWGKGAGPTWVMTLLGNALQLAAGVSLQAPITDVGGQVFNVKAYGAKGDGVTDDYLAINAALAAAKVAPGGVCYFPSGTYLITQPINGTLTGSETYYSIQGANPNTTVIKFAPAANSWATKPVLDCTSAFGITIRDIHFNSSNDTRRAGCGILLHSGSGQGSNSKLDRVFVDGFYDVSPLWVYAYGDTTFSECSFTQNAANGHSLVFTTENGAAKGVTMASQYDAAHFLTGEQNCGDMTFTGSEIHNESTVSQRAAVYLRGTGSMRWYGGVIASKGGVSHFECTSGATYQCNQLTIVGTQLYPEAGTTINNQIIDVTTGQTIDGVTLINANCSALAIFGSSNGALFSLRNVLFVGTPTIGAAATYFVNHGATSNYEMIRDSILFLDGLNLRLPGPTGTSLALLNPGTVTCNFGVPNHVNLRLGTGANDIMKGSAVVRVPMMSYGVRPVAVGTTYYGFPGSAPNTDANNYAIAPYAGTLSNLYMASSGAPGAAQTYTATLYKNGSATALGATISGASATSANDTTNAVSVAAGDSLQIRLSTTGGVALNDVTVSLVYQIAPS
jgi:hypothetical protein